MLYYFMGCPRSGKSTLARQFLKYQLDFVDGKPSNLREGMHEDDNPRVVINSDALRLAMHGQVWAGEAEGLVACIAEINARAFLNEGYDVLIDETNTSEASLIRIYRVARDCKVEAVPVVMWTSPEVCKERAIKTKQEYLFPVIERCWKQLNDLRGEFESKINSIKKYLDTHI